jgi:hypothetical protein
MTNLGSAHPTLQPRLVNRSRAKNSGFAEGKRAGPPPSGKRRPLGRAVRMAYGSTNPHDLQSTIEFGMASAMQSAT